MLALAIELRKRVIEVMQRLVCGGMNSKEGGD